MATGIIDLDRMPAEVPRPPIPLHRRLSVPRTVRVVIVLLGTLLMITTAAPPLRGIGLLLSAGGQPAAAFALAPGALFTASFGNNPNSESGLRRWNLADGTLSWAASVPQNVQNLEYDDSAHILMGRSGAEPRVIFLNGDTGEVLWQDSTETSVVRMAAGRVLMMASTSTGRETLQLVEARTGREVWRRTIGETAYFDTDGQGPGETPRRVIVVDTTGRVTVLGFADGAVRAQLDLGVGIPVQVAEADAPDYASVAAAGDRLYLSRRRQGVTTLTAWSLDSLTRRWQTTGGPVGAVYGCGPVLCVNSETFSAVDPADGRVLWQRTGLNIVPGYDGRTLLGYDWSDNPQTVALDPLTGRVLDRLGTSTVVGPVLLRADSVVPGRTWVEVTGADGALHLVGGLDTGAAYGCEALGLDLACPTTAGPTQVWRLPSGE